MSPLQQGDEITIAPTELVAGGAAIARVDGFPVFATNVFPGDVAVVRLFEVKKGFGRADLAKIVTPGPFRRELPCPIAGECGGCDWTALRLDKQLEAKHRILTESLRRIGKVDPATLPPITLHASPLNYRIRSRLHRDPVTGAVGFYSTRSNDVVPLAAECEVVGLETARAFGVRRSSGAAIVGKGTPLLREEDTVGEATADGDREIWEVDGLLISDDREVTIRAADREYVLSTDSFFQVNRHLLDTMVRLVIGHASRVMNKRVAIDLYAGAGFFSAPLASQFERVVSVEGSPVSHAYAKRNVPANVQVIHSPVEGYLQRMPRADFLFLDPPRAGARAEVIHAVARRTREIIAYLSCDPVTLSRDASRLIASGWRLSTLDLLDLFPNTHHLETLASFERAR